MSVYEPLVNFLMKSNEPSITLSFQQLEELLGRVLPKSAKTYQPFWSSGNHVGRLIRAAGWVASPSFRYRQVIFRRTGVTQGKSSEISKPASWKLPDDSRPDLVLIGCVKSKRDGRHRVKDLYTSTLFAGRAGYAQSTAKPWYVLSSEYGLLDPDEEVDTYDLALKDLPILERRTWSLRVLDQIERKIGDVRGKVVEIHAGKSYRDFGLMQGLEERGALVNVPLADFRHGEQLAWYATRAALEAHAVVHRRPVAKAEVPLSVEIMPASEVRDIVATITSEFSNSALELSRRSNPPVCGWQGIPEIKMAATLRSEGVDNATLRIILTLGVSLDRARDADRLWDAVLALYRSDPWAFDPNALKSADRRLLLGTLMDSGVSRRHRKDCEAWQQIAAALLSGNAPEPVRRVVYAGEGNYQELLQAISAQDQGGKPWFPLLRGPKIRLVWLRMLVEPGGARIEGIDQMPVAVDVQVRRTTEYLGVAKTSGMDLNSVREEIQSAWHQGAEAAVGPVGIASTAAALDPVIWFFGKWGCSHCERRGMRVPISSVCGRCHFDRELEATNA